MQQGRQAAAQEDFESYSLKLKGFRVPDIMKPRDYESRSSGSYELTEKGKHSRLLWSSKIEGKIYHIAIPRAWVEANVPHTPN